MPDFEAVKVTVFLPNVPPFTLGVLLIDRQGKQVKAMFRDIAGEGVDPVDAEVLMGLPEFCASMIQTEGADALLRWLDDVPSNAIRVSRIFRIAGDTPDAALEAAYRKDIDLS